MIRDFRFLLLGSALDSQGKKAQLEFRMTLAPSALKFTVYLMGRFASFTLNSERFDFKARARDEHLDSRREWFSSSSLDLIGDVWVVEPLESRGRQIEICANVSWDPCFFGHPMANGGVVLRTWQSGRRHLTATGLKIIWLR